VEKLSQALELTSNKATTEDEQKILEGIVSFGNTETGQIMTPRIDIFGISNKELYEDVVANIVNYGENGYTSTQGLIRLQMELQRGNIPDVVVFYDGVNDLYGAFFNRIAGYPINVHNRYAEFNVSQRFYPQGMFPHFMRVSGKILGSFGEQNKYDYPNEEAQEGLQSVYLANVRMVEALAKEYEFTPLFYWQGSIHTKDQWSEAEEKIAQGDEREEVPYEDISLEMIGASRGSVVSLVDVFDSVTSTIYIDSVHITESGNDIIGSYMSKDLVSILKKQYEE